VNDPTVVPLALDDTLNVPLAAAIGVEADAVIATRDGDGTLCLDVPASAWPAAATFLRDRCGLDFFDWLSAVDELDRGYAIVAHLWSTARRHGVLVRTHVPRAAAALDSVVEIFPGAAWHERETHEMFGVDFPGHPNLAPLLLPPEFEGHPLRKEFVLATRVAKPWPGAKEPGQSHVEGTAKRQPMRPPGVPAPGEWGPQGADDPGEED